MLDAIPGLVANISVTGAVVGPAGAAGYSYHGGRSAFFVFGTTLPTNVLLQLLGMDGTTWVTVASVSSAGITALDLPPGYYRGNLSGGSPSAVYAGLFTVPYKK